VLKSFKHFLVLFAIALLLILFIPFAFFKPATAAIKFATYVPEMVDYTLPNGLRVILAKDNTAPVVAVNLWYQVGAANDPPQRSGFAHLFEHMMFDGSAHVKRGEYDAYLQHVGGMLNASTNPDYTDYFQIIPANQLPLVLWLESDRMASLNVTQAGFDIQRQVVIQELNQRVLNAPYGRSDYLHTYNDPFSGYPPYERPPIGSIEDLNAASLEEITAFHRQYYLPNNATLVIVGDIEFEPTKTLVEAYFGEIPPGEPVTPILDRYPLPEPFPARQTDATTGCQLGSQQTLIDPLIELPKVSYSVVTPARGDRDFYALNLLASILSDGKSSRFQQQLVLPGLVSEANAEVAENIGASLLLVEGTPKAGESVESVASLLQAQLRDIAAKGVTEAELARVKQQVKIQTIKDFRSSVLNTASMLQQITRQFGKPQAILQDMANFEAVTAKDIQRVAQMYLCQRPINALMTLKTGTEVLASSPGQLVKPVNVPVSSAALKTSRPTPAQLATLPPGVVSRAQPPQALAAKATQLPPYEVFSLKNGLQVLFVEQHKIPQLQLQLFVGGSNVAVAKDKQGIPSLLATVMLQGTTQATAAQIADKVESVGGSINASAGLEFMSVSVDVPAPNAAVGFEVLADVTRNPTLPQSAFEVAKSQRLTDLANEQTDPDVLASRQFKRVAYPNHPYGFLTLPETVKGISRDDLVAFHQTFFKPNNALLVIVGDLSDAEARAQAERVFGDWKPGQVPDFFAYPRNRLGDTSVIYLINRPGSQQSTLHIGNLGLTARDRERYALSAVNTVLGSGFAGRLFKNLREDKGYTYGAYTSLTDTTRDRGTFLAYTDVSTAHTGEAIQEILKELQTIRTQSIPDSELAATKGLLVGNFALGLENPAQVAAQLATLQLNGVPLAELQAYPQRIEKVTAHQAIKVAKKYLAAQPIIVVVSDAAAVKPQLEKLGRVIEVIEGISLGNTDVRENAIANKQRPCSDAQGNGH
jgi:zinc protease